MDERLNALRAWLQETLNDPAVTLTPASEDASFRRYFRLSHGQRTLIAMDAPPKHEDIETYMLVARRLLTLGLNVPEVMAADIDRGFLLITDLGSATYLKHLNPATAERLYGDALAALVVLQTGTFSPGPQFPAYDRALLLKEMELFREWYVPRYAPVPLAPHEHRMLDQTFATLADSALEQPQVFVHRDYHSRNLMVCPDHNPGILDFQDAVTGPVTYDLVSLLKDCYIVWPDARVRDWALRYHDLAHQSGLLSEVAQQRFLAWFDRMGVQRHIKVLGIFARLFVRDGKPAYLDDLPLVHRYLLEATARHADLSALHDLLARMPPRR